MSKEAKIGLGIVLVLLVVVGGVAAWIVFGKPGTSIAAAQSSADPKEKSKTEGEANTGSAESQSRYPRDGKESSKALISSPGHSQTKGKEHDLWKGAADYRNERPSAGEATANSSQTLPMPDPPAPGNVDSDDRYTSNPNSSMVPSSDPMGPPGDAATASGGRRHGELNENRLPEDDRWRDRSLVNGNIPPEGVQPAPSPSTLRGNNRNNDSLRHGQDGMASAGDNHYGKAPNNDRGMPGYRNNPNTGYVPNQSPNAAFAGHERRRLGANAYAGPNEPSVPANGMRGDGTYDVQPNDSFWEISKKIYGTGAYYQALETLNRGKAVDGQLKVGLNILTPDVAELEKKYPKLCPKANHSEVLQNKNASFVSTHNPRDTRSYTVVEGDTLFDIARYELGKASRWAEIYDLNRNELGKDFDYLVPGTELKLPENTPERSDPVTRRPSVYQR